MPESKDRCVTVAFSIPKSVSDDITRLAKDLNVSKSSLMTAIVSAVMKWVKPEDIFPGKKE